MNNITGSDYDAMCGEWTHSDLVLCQTQRRSQTTEMWPSGQTWRWRSCTMWKRGWERKILPTHASCIQHCCISLLLTAEDQCDGSEQHLDVPGAGKDTHPSTPTCIWNDTWTYFHTKYNVKMTMSEITTLSVVSSVQYAFWECEQQDKLAGSRIFPLIM